MRDVRQRYQFGDVRWWWSRANKADAMSADLWRQGKADEADLWHRHATQERARANNALRQEQARKNGWHSSRKWD